MCIQKVCLKPTQPGLFAKGLILATHEAPSLVRLLKEGDPGGKWAHLKAFLSINFLVLLIFYYLSGSTELV